MFDVRRKNEGREINFNSHEEEIYLRGCGGYTRPLCGRRKSSLLREMSPATAGSCSDGLESYPEATRSLERLRDVTRNLVFSAP